MASLQAKHRRTCAIGKSWTTFEAATEGCTCPQGPTYYVVVREGSANHKTRVGQNRKVAERALRKIGVTIDDGSYQPQQNIAFDVWAERWLESLERKRTTVDSYGGRSTTPGARFARSGFATFGPRTSRTSTQVCATQD